MHMNHYNAYDGAATVTQCPILPEEAFRYIVPTAEQYGT